MSDSEPSHVPHRPPLLEAIRPVITSFRNIFRGNGDSTVDTDTMTTNRTGPDWAATILNLREAQSKPPPAPKEKERCIICAEHADEESNTVLLRPCRTCDSFYCNGCLADMFTAAVEDASRMPPKCHTLLQIHTALPFLQDDEAKAYRAKFEEWISPVKTYCPAPTCSAFIPERKLPKAVIDAATSTTPTTPSTTTTNNTPSTTSTSTNTPTTPTTPGPASLRNITKEVLSRITASPAARFFRGEMDITLLPGFTHVVKRHMDLSIIADNLEAYQTVHQVTADMQLIVSNTIEYNGPKHPVTDAAHELFYQYAREMLGASEERLGELQSAKKGSDGTPTSPLLPLLPLATQPRTDIFPCPTCHIAICTSCKQIEHTGSPCDTSAADYEWAMLRSYGYKRCPRCKAGVKKMYGCAHIQCVCGAHWCYWCQRSYSMCQGECDARDDDEEYDGEEDEEEEEEREQAVRDLQRLLAAQREAWAEADGDVADAEMRDTNAESSATTATADSPPEDSIVNLDAGGGHYWEAQGLELGEEPEEIYSEQVWSCHHKFKSYEPAIDGFNHGDLSRMECNRCFDRVAVRKPAPPPAPAPAPSEDKPVLKRLRRGSRFSKTATPVKPTSSAVEEKVAVKEAMECMWCRIVVCPSCQETYEAAAAAAAAAEDG